MEFGIIKELELKYNKNVYTILQLRYDENIKNIKKNIEESKEEFFEADLICIMPRGKWYETSWKSDIEKSGGILMNIGIRLFDMLLWFFENIQLYYRSGLQNNKASGVLYFEKATVNWYLSTDPNNIPWDRSKNVPYRIFKINNIGIDFFHKNGRFTFKSI